MWFVEFDLINVSIEYWKSFTGSVHCASACKALTSCCIIRQTLTWFQLNLISNIAFTLKYSLSLKSSEQLGLLGLSLGLLLSLWSLGIFLTGLCTGVTLATWYIPSFSFPSFYLIMFINRICCIQKVSDGDSIDILY